MSSKAGKKKYIGMCEYFAIQLHSQNLLNLDTRKHF